MRQRHRRVVGNPDVAVRERAETVGVLNPVRHRETPASRDEARCAPGGLKPANEAGMAASSAVSAIRNYGYGGVTGHSRSGRESLLRFGVGLPYSRSRRKRKTLHFVPAKPSPLGSLAA